MVFATLSVPLASVKPLLPILCGPACGPSMEEELDSVRRETDGSVVARSTAGTEGKGTQSLL